MPTLNTAFKQIFGEALEPLGFKKITGKYPYFVRLIEDEILHIITYRTEPMRRPGYKEFSILGGVATVYRQRISLDLPPKDNINWLRGNLEFYEKSNPFNEKPKYSFDDLYTFSYKEGAMLETVKHSSKITEEIMLPILNGVTDLNACIDFYSKFQSTILATYHDDDFGNKYCNNFYNEWLLYIKTNNHDDFMKNMNENTAIESRKDNPKEFIERVCKLYNESRLQKIANRDRIYNSSVLHSKALTELERRKAANIATLRSYGFSL